METAKRYAFYALCILILNVLMALSGSEAALDGWTEAQFIISILFIIGTGDMLRILFDTIRETINDD